MKNPLLMLSAIFLLIATSCSKSTNEPESKPETIETGTFLLSQITYENSSLIEFKYDDVNVNQILFSLFKDELVRNSAGQLESTTTYLVSDNTVYRFNKIYYGDNKKISRIEHYNAQKTSVSESTDYTYNSSGKVTTITMTEGTRKSVSKYDYNQAGNVIGFTREIYPNGVLLKANKVSNIQFDDKKNPFVEMKDFEYYLSLSYQNTYDRLGSPIYPTKNNPVQSTGSAFYNGKLDSGDISSSWSYNSNGYPTENKFKDLVGGSLNVSYGFKYLIIK